MPININVHKKMSAQFNRALIAENTAPAGNNAPVACGVNSVKNVVFNMVKPSSQGDIRQKEIPLHNEASAINEKLPLYKDYSHYGYNPADIKSALETFADSLHHVMAENRSHIALAEKIYAMLPVLNNLTKTLLTPEERRKLPLKELSNVNKQEKIIRDLISTFSALPGILLSIDKLIQLPENSDVRHALADELVEGALARLPDGEEKEVWRRQLQNNIFSALDTEKLPTEVQRQLSYFFDSSLADMQNSVRKALREEMRQIKRSADRALSVIGEYAFLTDREFTDKVRSLVSVLDTFREELEEDCVEKKVSNPAQKEESWLPGKQQLNKIEHIPHAAKKKGDKLLEEMKLFFRRQKFASFLALSLEDKAQCLTLKKIVAPVQDNAMLVRQAAARLKKAIREAKDAEIKREIKVTTPEQAFFTELMLLTADTPQTRLISAIQHAKEVAEAVLRLPSPATTEFPAEPGDFLNFAQLSHEILISSAQALLNSAQQGEHDFSNEDLIAKLNYTKNTTEELQATINKGLESLSGVSVSDGDEGLLALNTKISRHWQAITTITKKKFRPYVSLQAGSASSEKQEERHIAVHQAVLPLLNETEKLRIACQQLEMALNAKVGLQQQRSSLLEKVAEQCRKKVPETILAYREALKNFFKDQDIPLCELVGGEALPTTMGSQLDQQAAELLNVIDTLQHASWLAEWVPYDKKGKAVDIVVSLQSCLTSIKASLKNVVEAGTGIRPHNNSPEGMIAKDAGEWLAGLKEEWITTNPELSQAESARAIDDMVEELVKQFTTEEDPEGTLFRTRIRLAIQDAEKGEVPWPLTPEQHLAKTLTKKDYTLAWAEKRLTYGVIFNLLFNQSLMGLFSLSKNALVSPLRLINFLLTPARKEVTKRAIKKVRPGNVRPTKQLAEHASRENFQAAFRFISMLSPQLLKTVVASGIVSYGLIKGGEYRDGFLSRALSRLPGDLFWTGLFTGWQQLTQGDQTPEKPVPVSDNEVNEQPHLRLSENIISEQPRSVLSKNLVDEQPRPTLLENPAEQGYKRSKRHIQDNINPVAQDTSEAGPFSVNVLDSSKHIDKAQLPLIVEALQNGLVDPELKEKFTKFHRNALAQYTAGYDKDNVDVCLSIIKASITDWESNKQHISPAQYVEQFKFTDALWKVLNKTSIPVSSVTYMEEIATRIKPWLDIKKVAVDEAAMRKLSSDLDKASNDTLKKHPSAIKGKKDIGFLLEIIKQHQKIIDEYEIKYGSSNYLKEKQLQVDTYLSEASKLTDKDSQTKLKSFLYRKPVFTYTPDPRGAGYASVESQIAGNLVRSVYWHQNDQGHTATFGNRYEAEKALLTSLLAAKNVKDLNKLPETWYKGVEAERLTELFLEDFCELSKTQRNACISEASRQFYLSLCASHPGEMRLNIKGLEEKKLSSYSEKDKINAFNHYLQQPMEFEYNPESGAEKIIQVAAFFMMARSLMNMRMTPGKSPLSTGGVGPATYIRTSNMLKPKKVTGKIGGKKVESGVKINFDKSSGKLKIIAKRNGIGHQNDWTSYREKVGNQIRGAINKYSGVKSITVENRLNKIGQRLADKTKQSPLKIKAKKTASANTRPHEKPTPAAGKEPLANEKLPKQQHPEVGEAQTTMVFRYEDNSGYGQLLGQDKPLGNSASRRYTVNDSAQAQRYSKGKHVQVPAAAMNKYYQWRRFVNEEGLDPKTAAKKVSDANPEKLHDGTFSFRLSQEHRVIYSQSGDTVTVHSVGGHYVRQAREANEAIE